MRYLALFAVPLAAAFALLAPAPSHAQGRECRDVPVTIDGQTQTQRMCREGAGPWRPAAAQTSSADILTSGVMPASFRGRATYRGGYRAVVSTPPRRRERGLAGLLQADTKREIEGLYTITLNFEPNNIVTGTATLTGEFSGGPINGTRQGDRCRLTISPSGAVFEGICSPTVFSGTWTSSTGEKRYRFTMAVDLPITEFVDAGEEQREAQRQAAIAKEARRQAAIRELPLLWQRFDQALIRLDGSNQKFGTALKRTDDKATICVTGPPIYRDFAALDDVFQKIGAHRREFPDVDRMSQQRFTDAENVVTANRNLRNTVGEICSGF